MKFFYIYCSPCPINQDIIIYLENMSIKDQAIEKCHKAWNFAQSNAKKLYHSIADNERVQEGATKVKGFYQNHKQICIGVGIAIVAFFFIRRRIHKSKDKTIKQTSEKQKINKVQQEASEKQQKKKLQIFVPPATSKKFMDEDDVEFFPDEPSTDIVRKQKIKRKSKDESSQNQREDRIFFEMYNTYRKTDPDE